MCCSMLTDGCDWLAGLLSLHCPLTCQIPRSVHRVPVRCWVRLTTGVRSLCTDLQLCRGLAALMTLLNLCLLRHALLPDVCGSIHLEDWQEPEACSNCCSAPCISGIHAAKMEAKGGQYQAFPLSDGLEAADPVCCPIPYSSHPCLRHIFWAARVGCPLLQCLIKDQGIWPSDRPADGSLPGFWCT